MDPKKYKTHLLLARALIQAEKEKRAMEVYQDAIEYFPNRAEVYFHQGDLLQSIGRMGEAEEAYQRYIELASPQEKGTKKYEEAKEFLIKIRGASARK